MHVSLNEVLAMATKAAAAAGLPIGLAEEAGHAATWLCAQGEDGVGAVLQAIGPAAEPAPPAFQETERGWRVAPAPVGLIGASVVDILLAEPGRPVLLEKVDAPLLLLGIVGQALARSPGAGAVSVALGGVTVRVAGDGLAAEAGLPSAGVDAELAMIDAAAGATTAPKTGVEADPQAWAELCDWAAQIRVPANPLSRSQGAGAGDIDNE